MRAVVINRHGGPEVLELTELPDPIINENEVLVRVKACALNHLDVWVRRGLKGVEFPMPHVLGCDIAGVVESVGRLVRNTRPGEEVVLSPGVSCMHCEYCLSERDNQCASYDILGYRANGGYAEYVKAPSVNVLAKPKNLSFEEAASIPLVFLTAWHMLVDRVNLRPGETLLVHAAGSGVGNAASAWNYSIPSYAAITLRRSSMSCGRVFVSGGRTGPAGLPIISIALFTAATS